jgi:peptidoglycan-associated lipoprotein
MRRYVLALAILGVAAGSSACATKGFVRTNVGDVNEKVETLTQSVEETQERTRRNEARIGEVDEKAVAANREAREARTVAEQAGERIDDVERASRRLIYEVVISTDQGNFAFGQTALPEEAKAELDRLVAELKADPQGAYIEIEGHTDSIGPLNVNQRIGLERAEAVKRYLYEEHQVPLHRINVISYGPERPIAPNNTREGRAQNRRVVVKVLT